LIDTLESILGKNLIFRLKVLLREQMADKKIEEQTTLRMKDSVPKCYEIREKGGCPYFPNDQYFSNGNSEAS